MITLMFLYFCVACAAQSDKDIEKMLTSQNK